MNHFVLASMCLFLVIVGMVMYYLNTRIKTLESSISQQNLMMSDVVASIRKDVAETEFEVESDAPVVEDEEINLDNRLYVSDDSVEESDTESDLDDNVKESKDEVPTYKNMKVEELRKLIKDSDLTPSEGVSKLKKWELIDILTK